MDRDGRRGWRRRACEPSAVARPTRRKHLLFQAALTVGVICAPTVPDEASSAAVRRKMYTARRATIGHFFNHSGHGACGDGTRSCRLHGPVHEDTFEIQNVFFFKIASLVWGRLRLHGFVGS